MLETLIEPVDKIGDILNCRYCGKPLADHPNCSLDEDTKQAIRREVKRDILDLIKTTERTAYRLGVTHRTSIGMSVLHSIKAFCEGDK